jgi:hypothetical protein
MVCLRVVRVAGRRTAREVARWLCRAVRTRWLTKQAPSPWSVNTAPNPCVGCSDIPSACAIRTAAYLTVKYPRRYDVRGAGHLRLARIGDSLPLEVPIGIATLHQFPRDSAHKAEDDLQASEQGFRASTRPFYESPERKRRGVGAEGWEVCYATREGASQTRRGGGNANVIFG